MASETSFMMRSILFAGVALFSCLGAGTASAAAFYGPFEFSVPVAGGSIPITFPQYAGPDPLRTVTFSFTALQAGGSVAFENRSATPIQGFGFRPTITITVTTPNFTSSPPTFPFPPPPPNPVANLAAYGGTPDFSGPDSFTANLGSLRTTETRNYGPLPPAGFAGTGLVSATLDINFGFVFGGTPSGNTPAVRFSNAGPVTGTFSVGYNIVPEPSSALGLLIGLSGVAYLRVRRAG